MQQSVLAGADRVQAEDYLEEGEVERRIKHAVRVINLGVELALNRVFHAAGGRVPLHAPMDAFPDVVPLVLGLLLGGLEFRWVVEGQRHGRLPVELDVQFCLSLFLPLLL